MKKKYIKTKNISQIFKGNKFGDFLFIIFFSFFYNQSINNFSRLEEFLNESSGRIIKRIVLSLESFSYQLIVLQSD